MRHVILGAGPAGVIAAETIRKHAPNDEIVIVGDEPEPPYSRMAIPYLLMGNDRRGGHAPAPRLRSTSSKLRIDVRRARAKAGRRRASAASRWTTAARSPSTRC